MRLKLTLTLLLLNLLVFGLIVFLERRERTAPGTGPGAGLLGEFGLNLTTLEIAGPALPQPRRLARSPDGRSWNITQPVEWPANLFAVARILNQLHFLSQDVSFSLQEISAAGQSLADYGLDPPVLALRLGDGRSETVLQLGAPTELGNRLYLLGPTGDRVYVVHRNLLESLSVPLAELRDNRIFSIPVFEVRSLTLRVTAPGDLTVRLLREGESWRFEAPLTAAAEPTLVATTIRQLTGIEAQSFFDPGSIDPAATGLLASSRRVTLEGNGRRQTLHLGNPLPDSPEAPAGGLVYARLEDSPAVVAVPAAPFEELLEAQRRLRDPALFALDPAALNTIEIAQQDTLLRLQKLESGSWQVLRPLPGDSFQPRDADPALLAAMVKALTGLPARDFVSDAPSESALRERYQLLPPAWTVTLRTPESAAVLLIGGFYRTPDDQRLLYARVENRPTIYGLDLDVLRWLRTAPLYYRHRTLRQLPPGAAIQGLRITRLGDESPLFDWRLDKPTDTWEAFLQQPGLAPAQAAAGAALLQNLRTFQVQEYLRESFSAHYLEEPDKTIPWAWRLDVTLRLTGATEAAPVTESWFFTERLSGSFQAGGSPEQQLVFSLAPAWLETLSALLPVPEPPPGFVAPTPTPVPTLPLPPPAGDSRTPQP